MYLLQFLLSLHHSSAAALHSVSHSHWWYIFWSLLSRGRGDCIQALWQQVVKDSGSELTGCELTVCEEHAPSRRAAWMNERLHKHINHPQWKSCHWLVFSVRWSDDLLKSAFQIFNVFTARKITLCQTFLFWGPSLLPFILPLSVDIQHIPALYFCHHPSLFLRSRAICYSPLVLTSFFPSPLAPSPCNRSGIVFWLSRALWFQRDREQTSLKSAWRKCAQPSAMIINIFLTFIQSQQNCQKDTKITKFRVETLCCVLFS